VERHGGRVCLVQLLCSDAARESRLNGASRIELNKITSIELMRQMMNEGDLLSPVPGRTSLTIDNTNLQPEEVANRITDHFGLVSGPQVFVLGISARVTPATRLKRRKLRIT
jgi:RNase adaptor protein for sRNA GlmZ degradation